MKTLEQFKIQLQALLNDEQFNAIKPVFLNYIKENESIGKDVTQLYADYAFLMFELGLYDDFFEAMDKAIELNYPLNIYEDILLEAFINPNIEQLKMNYNQNIILLKNLEFINPEYFLSFADLNYIVPTQNNDEFYIINKKSLRIVTKISLEGKLDLTSINSFFDILIVDNNIHILEFLGNNDQKKYMMIDNLTNFLTLLQLRELNPKNVNSIEKIFFDLKEFEKYFLVFNQFIPKNIINNSEHISNDVVLKQINNLIERRSLKKERPRPLLTIGIPTYNRGERALKNLKNILEFPFDFEIEIVVSNNGTKNETAIHYEEIKRLNLPNVNYFEFNENQGVSLNICKVAELAKGKFLLFLSDEDSINLEVLYNVMADLRDEHKQISIYRTSSLREHCLPKMMKTKGRDALLTYGLTSNYVSGNIFHVDFLKDNKVIDYVRNNQENEICYLYPHVCFELFLTQYGNVYSTDEKLIFEGDAEGTDVAPKSFKQQGAEIPTYAFLEERLKQHSSFVEIFRELEIVKQDEELAREIYLKLVNKTFYLLSIAIDLHYLPNGYDLKTIIDKCYLYCTNKDFLVGNRIKRKWDLKVIEGLYDSFLTRYC